MDKVIQIQISRHQVLKGTLVGLISLGLIDCVVVMFNAEIVATGIAHHMARQSPPMGMPSPADLQAQKALFDNFVTAIVVGSIFTALILIVGLVAVVKEFFGLMVAFAGMMAISTGFQLWAIRGAQQLFQALVNSSMTVLAAWFAFRIWRRKSFVSHEGFKCVEAQ